MWQSLCVFDTCLLSTQPISITWRQPIVLFISCYLHPINCARAEPCGRGRRGSWNWSIAAGSLPQTSRLTVKPSSEEDGDEDDDSIEGYGSRGRWQQRGR
jgi:hypothetical protein